ncbi:histidinol-phosphate transaminase [Legionella taurinensis]|uniref:Histidinol-phosphate aminotransferase n=1 Tax=Legionella taurinensis TaxID=70611 RepID=A0AB38N9C5_9GAMM|nr:histidinol-phosphate transaminase [Legionella taurinensis]MDX1836970.1 histidinol-phosphate transaminase [Legionella taurinensis]PUT41378.1 histidinol-phosphate transaminase [Legionella taurinensis]PUT42617.1 histidinol-phosphate transaminase [Legionella taurinensis]PUT46645.1 histidinol-phosphate transaminase [Legionella taurinensis]PUT47294.1 histidinol-phosphate transaminase [Legionella taurinensis]
MSILDLIRPDLKNIKQYVPDGDRQSCRLHANELPWSPIQLNEVALNHYPSALQVKRLEQRLAQLYQVDEDQLVITRGSDDGLDLLMRLFLRGGSDSILQCPPTFPMYAFYAQLQQAGIRNCPLNAEDQFNFSLDALRQQWQPDCKLIIVCRPNNPTGGLIDLQTVSDMCEQWAGKSMVIADEAYIEFAQTESTARLIPLYDNLIVLRTLSKAYGMAGLRVGSILTQAPLIQAIQRIMSPFPFSSAVLDLAEQALSRQDWFGETVEKILVQREILHVRLSQHRLVDTVYPSRTNFLLVKSPHAQALQHWFAEQGIAVRHFPSSPLLQSMLRITVGDEQQNNRLMAALDAFPKQ